jgi:hypothetical protein
MSPFYMKLMSNGTNTPPIIAGFIEGLLAPVVELIIAVMVTALNAVNSATGSPDITWFIALFSIMEILRSIFACILHTEFAIGNVIGNVFGIIIFYGAVSTISSEAANSSLLLTIILIISLILGIFLTIWRNRDNY